MVGQSGEKHPLNYFIDYPKETSIRYKTQIEYNQLNLSGIMVIRFKQDTLRAVMLNEFGIKYFELYCTQNKCRINNLLSGMDKWYIRKILESDFLLLFKGYHLPSENKEKEYVMTRRGNTCKLHVNNNGNLWKTAYYKRGKCLKQVIFNNQISGELTDFQYKIRVKMTILADDTLTPGL
jgi:hypothetical protein